MALLSTSDTGGTERLSGTGPSGPITINKLRGYLILAMISGSGTFSTSADLYENIPTTTAWAPITAAASAAGDQIITQGCSVGVKFDTTDATAKWAIHWKEY